MNATHQMSLFELMPKTPETVPSSATESKPESQDTPHLMGSLLAEAPPAEEAAEIVEELPADPKTPPITGEGIPPVISRVFVKKAWQKGQSYFGYLYGYKSYAGSGRYGVVALDGQDYRKGHFYILDEHLVLIKES